jgi:phenylalanyl-tRNA synthetase alpha subunit
VSATLEEILAQALQQLRDAQDLNQLDLVRVHYLGKKGLFTLQMKELGALDPEQRRAAGKPQPGQRSISEQLGCDLLQMLISSKTGQRRY